MGAGHGGESPYYERLDTAQRNRPMPEPRHVPVMLREVLEYLAPRPGGVIVDATLGLGGHAAAFLERLGPAGRLIGVDQDAEALAAARRRLEQLCEARGWAPPYAFTLHRASFRALPSLLRADAVGPVHGALFDLGVSSLQLDDPARGFSFRAGGPLDMRMDRSLPVSAADLVNTLPEEDLARVIWELGEERASRRIARRIAARRSQAPLRTTTELAELVAGCFPAAQRHGRIHPATRTFQALRIRVNSELDALDEVLGSLADWLAPGGRVVVLSYHSLEDRIVKRALERLSGRCRCPPELPVCQCGAQSLVKILTRRPLPPAEAEVAANPRARSAKLRAAQRLEPSV